MKRIITLITLIIAGTITIAQDYGCWNEIDSMSIPRIYHSMVVLPDGNVLVTGNEADSIQSSCEIYDMSTGKWRSTTPMNVPRSQHGLVLLKTGKVLAIGGFKEQSCELFDPVTKTWTMTDSIPTYRNFGQTFTALNNGDIFVCGGMFIDTTSWDLVNLRDAEIYNVETGTWKKVTPMNLARWNHTATLLSDGRVLVTGGETDNLTSNNCEIYDPKLDTWDTVVPMNVERTRHAATLLKNGDVFVSGGWNGTVFFLNSCEVYNVNSNEWTNVSNMLFSRQDHHIYYLKKADKLLIIGSGGTDTGEETMEIFDPYTLEPLDYISFPIKQTLSYNNIQLPNENIFVAGGWQIYLYSLPAFYPTKRSWIFDVTTDVVEKNLSDIKDFHLEQNYPNPFNPTTTIRYSLQTTSTVKLAVYNTLGKEITTLLDKDLSPGNYKVNWEARDSNGMLLPSGVYLIKVSADNKAGNYTRTIKAVLLK